MTSTIAAGAPIADARYNLMELAEQLPDVISLGRGDPDLHTDSAIVEAGLASLGHGVPASPVRGRDALRAAIAERYQREKGLVFDPETEILITTGAQEGLFLTMLALVDPGDRVLVPDPRYSSYDQAIEAAGGTTVEIPTDLEHDFKLLPESVARVAPHGKVLLFINPNNPTGSLVPAAEVHTLARTVRDTGLVVVSDEIYESLVFEGSGVQSFAACDGMRDRTVTLSGFSKTYAMTGFRVGYVIGPPPFVAAVAALKAAAAGPCPLFSQQVALAALTGAGDVVERLRGVFNERRQVMMRGLESLGVPFSHPGGGFYLWADISRFGLPAPAFCKRLLLEARVLMFPGTSFGAQWNHYVRISLLQPRPLLEEALDRVGRFLQALEKEEA